MRIGVPKEIKNHEYRVGLVPSSVQELVHHGHQVLVETQSGMGINISDDDYIKAGASIAKDANQVFAEADMIIKVKEPQAVERKKLRENQILFTYMHLAPDAAQTHDLIASGAVCIAYETITAANGSLPLLIPMSEVAGRLAPQVGAHWLEKMQGGRGILMGGVPGVSAADVVILGGGVSGTQAAIVALGMGARVTVVDRSAEVLMRLATQFGSAISTVFSTRNALDKLVRQADLLIGTVLIKGATTPKLVSRAMLKTMKPGSVIVDVAIDQGGCMETSRATTHTEPTYVVDDVVHYCVANMPSAVARTSTFALNNVTLPFVLSLANEGWKEALTKDVHLRSGLNICAGKVTCEPVAQAHHLDYVPAQSLLGLSG